MVETYNWSDVIFKNWSQIVLFLGAIGYIIKSFTEWKFKKYEISFYKIQENKILEVKNFYKCYNQLDAALFTFTQQTLDEQVMNEKAKELRYNIDIAYVELRNNCLSLKLFINENEIKTIDEILGLYQKVTIEIALWNVRRVAKTSNWNYFKDEFYDIQGEKIPDLIKEFERSFRASYNLDEPTFLEKTLLYFRIKKR